MEEQNLSPTPSPEARQWAMFCHFAAFAGLLIPFGNLLGPLVVWQLKRESDPFIDKQGKESLNFQITVAIAAAISLLLMVLIIGFFLLGLLAIGALVGFLFRPSEDARLLHSSTFTPFRRMM